MTRSDRTTRGQSCPPRPARGAAAWLVVLVVVACAVIPAGLRWRAELGRTTAALAPAEHALARVQGRLEALEPATDAATGADRALRRSITEAQAALARTDSQLSTTEEGLVAKGIAVYDLGACLTDVTEALDQVSVGQTEGAITALAGAAPSCAVAPPEER